MVYLVSIVIHFQLTPEEFVAAGEHLVHHCPSWQWAAGDSSLRRDYLPADKQFLVTKNVPCYKRCGDMMSECNKAVEKVIEAGEGDDGEEGWVDTHHSVEGGAEDAAEKVKEMKLDDEDDKVVETTENKEKRPEVEELSFPIVLGVLPGIISFLNSIFAVIVFVF